MQHLKYLGNPLCTLCPLYEHAKTICVMGNGSVATRILVVGEGSGATEDEQGIPFVGKAGKLLDETLKAAGLERDLVYVTNVVKCRPPEDRKPEKEEIDACLPYLVRESQFIKPTHVLLLGNTALHALTNLTDGITRHRGYVPGYHSAFVNSETYATYHPSAAMYSKAVRDVFEQDVKIFAKIVRQFWEKEEKAFCTHSSGSLDGDVTSREHK